MTISPTTATLGERLTAHAGTDAVFAVVAERLYDRILGPADSHPELTGDRELLPYFRDADGRLIDRARLERHMGHFLAAALGGPPRYRGRTMAAAHAGRGITDAAFDRVVGHVAAVLTELQVPADWIAEVAAAVAPLREQVVGVPG